MEQENNDDAPEKVLKDSSTNDLQNDDARSTETAGPIRGFFRSIAARFSSGKLPTPAAPVPRKIPRPSSRTATSVASSASKAANKARVPRNVKVKVNVNQTNAKGATKMVNRLVRKRRGARVAKVSDAASTGYDAVSSVNQNQEESKDSVMKDGKRNKQKRNWNWSGAMTKSIQFTGSFIQNSILGTAVFEVYEFSLYKFIPTKQSNIQQHEKNFWEKESQKFIQGDNNTLQDRKGTSTVSNTNSNLISNTVPLHFLAGGIAGFAHGVLSIVIDATRQMVTSNATLNRPSSNNFSFPIIFSSFGSIAHHSISHSVLFGSYEFWKQSFVKPIAISNPSQISDDTDSNSKNVNEDEQHVYKYGDWNHVMAVLAAGGIAGSSQHFVNHYTEHVLARDDLFSIQHSRNPTATSSISCSVGRFSLQNFQNMLFRIQLSRSIPKAPSVRSILLAFPPSGIGFLAFEYGKEISS